MIKILLLICALWVTPFATADESVMVTAAIEKPAFYYTICLPAMTDQERLYNVTGEDHAFINSDGTVSPNWDVKWPDGDGFNRGDGPFEIGWRI